MAKHTKPYESFNTRTSNCTHSHAPKHTPPSESTTLKPHGIFAAAFQGISAQDAEELNASALSVYDRYFQDEETCGTLGLDQATLQSIDEAFAAAGKTRDGVDKDVFNLAVGKVYEYIKSELMPKFLVSEHFRKVKRRGATRAVGWYSGIVHGIVHGLG